MWQKCMWEVLYFAKRFGWSACEVRCKSVFFLICCEFPWKNFLLVQARIGLRHGQPYYNHPTITFCRRRLGHQHQSVTCKTYRVIGYGSILYWKGTAWHGATGSLKLAWNFPRVSLKSTWVQPEMNLNSASSQPEMSLELAKNQPQFSLYWALVEPWVSLENQPQLRLVKYPTLCLVFKYPG